ncbi:MAG: recombinase family protein [Candidatus Accumulibacter sp.]|uniref:Recombinase family protein n=1 Tax=Candidatus Accumulibacter affinis TaxID=2954384 RepID=A0A935T9H8_9PROT|nr:recombinase family protein [Candidatus Accumulibacter affinis]
MTSGSTSPSTPSMLRRKQGLLHIASQRAEGWIPVSDDYIDPGFTGGNMDRPGLKRLMTDIEAGKIDIVVVYKIDRLTRSLGDFSRLIEVFERRRVSFVSVTQQFNTTTSMGRLMLNILLSFAQFEREVTGERIRDKIAASKAKGMWMGGHPPLGYRIEDRRLIVVDVEANLVRRIFTDFTRCRSTTDLVRQLAADGKTNKQGKPFSKQMLYKLMHNRVHSARFPTRERATPVRTKRSLIWRYGMRLTRFSRRTIGNVPRRRGNVANRRLYCSGCSIRRTARNSSRRFRASQTASAIVTTCRTGKCASVPMPAKPAGCQRNPLSRWCWRKSMPR